MARWKVLDVGNCGPDHSAIKSLIEGGFDAVVEQAQGIHDTLASLANADFSLVLVNRKLDHDYSDGIEVIKAIKADNRLADVPVMLVSNLPEYQQSAVDVGAVWGFGKLELHTDETHRRLSEVLAS